MLPEPIVCLLDISSILNPAYSSLILGWFMLDAKNFIKRYPSPEGALDGGISERHRALTLKILSRYNNKNF